MKRLIDIVVSFFAIIFLSPLFILLALLVVVVSGLPILYKQVRIGKNHKPFKILKFRSMRNNADKAGLLTVGADNRITSIGKLLRKTKLDELPQLFNILKGDMSLVGPRPEVLKYVELYNDEQGKVLTVKPGLTDYASIKFINEDELLGQFDDPEKAYIEEIMPKKLTLNLEYIAKQNNWTDFKILLKTIVKIIA